MIDVVIYLALAGSAIGAASSYWGAWVFWTMSAIIVSAAVASVLRLDWELRRAAKRDEEERIRRKDPRIDVDLADV